jgi:uncharacterized membrane protein
MPNPSSILAAAFIQSTDCRTDGSTLYCRLTSVLDILYIVAIVLGVVLIVIAVFAYLAYRRNRSRNLQNSDQEQDSR